MIDPALIARQSELIDMPNAPLWHGLGHNRVLITSVHGFMHMRRGQPKPKDDGSLPFSYLLALASGSHWMAVGDDALPDSNHHADTEFKRHLPTYIRDHAIEFVIDIHGAHAARPFDLDLGTLHGSSWQTRSPWRDLLLCRLAQTGFYSPENHTFSGKGSDGAQTVVQFCFDSGIPAIQTEINSSILCTDGNRTALRERSKLLHAFTLFIQDIQS